MNAIKHSEETIAKVNQLEIVYDTFGDPEEPPILLIMGLGGQLVNWDEGFCSKLASHSFWVIRYDNRDTGLSTKFDDDGVPDILAIFQAVMSGQEVETAYTLSDMADDAAGLMDAVGIDSAHVAGMSMGGLIAQILSLNYPERVRSLTSIMSSTNEPDLPLPDAKASKYLFKRAPSERDAYIERQFKMWQDLDGTKYRQDEAVVRTNAAKAYDRAYYPQGITRQLAAIMTTPGRREALRDLNIPALIIHGNEDLLVPVTCGIDTAEAIPNAKLKIIEGMGHSIPESLHAEVVTAIVQHAASAE